MSNCGPTKWGIISCGRISHDWTLAISTLDPQEHQILGTAARNFASAKKFANLHGIPRVYQTYEELMRDSEIEIVYIGSIHVQHFEHVKMALSHDKHVLCESPLTMTVAETKELIEFARNKKLFLMEAIWSRFFPACQKLKEELKNGTIGEVHQIIVDMGLTMSEETNDWRMDSQLGGGAVQEFATFPIQFIHLVYGALKPEKIVAAGTLNAKGADVGASSILIFPGGKIASIILDYRVNLPCQAMAVGTKGTLKLHYPMWAPTKLETPNKLFSFDLPQIQPSDKQFNYLNSAGLSYQCQEVRRCLQDGLLESPEMTWKDTLLIGEIREAVLKQVGVSYL